MEWNRRNVGWFNLGGGGGPGGVWRGPYTHVKHTTRAADFIVAVLTDLGKWNRRNVGWLGWGRGTGRGEGGGGGG